MNFFVGSRGLLALCDIHDPHPTSSSCHIDLTRYIEFPSGSTLYICNAAISEFVRHALPHIRTPFVLVSGDSDDAMPYGPLTHSEFQTLIQSPFLMHWFCQNLLLPVVGGSRVSHLPIGLDYHTLEAHVGIMHPWGPGCTAAEQERQLRMIAEMGRPLPERRLVCYSNFHHAAFGINERGDRRACLAQVPRELIVGSSEFTDRSTCWQEQIACAFVLSPRGGGYDCHRTWEALALGCIPIVKSSRMDPLFEDLPVLIVSEWSDITAELLHQTMCDFTARRDTFRMEKLTMAYWRGRIKSSAIRKD